MLSVGVAISLSLTQAKREDTLDLCRLLNDDLAATVAKHPNRFIALGTLPMQAPELAVKELERCVKVRERERGVNERERGGGGGVSA